MNRRPTTERGLGVLVVTVLIGTAAPVRAEIYFYDDLATWQGDVAGEQVLTTTAAHVAQASEVASLPGTNAQLCDGLATCQLTFPSASTGLPWSFVLRPLEDGAGLTFDDAETGDPAPFLNAISIGDVNDFEDDDFQVEITGPNPVYALGLFITDNGSTGDEGVLVFGAAGILGISAVGYDGFFGVVSTTPITSLLYAEDSGGDDIAVRDFWFADSIQTDLQVVKTGPATATPGLSLSYQVEVLNQDALFTVAGARMTDAFPGSLSGCVWTCTPGTGASCTGGPVSGDLDDAAVVLGPGRSVVYDVTCDIDPGAPSSVINTATVTPPDLFVERTPGDDTDSVTTTMIQVADLAITKSDGSDTAAPGGTITYTIGVTNAGPSDATGAVATDSFPGGVSGVSWTCAATGGGACAASGSGDLSQSVDVPVGGGVTFTATGTVAASATGTLSNTASVSGPSGGSDPDTSNNSATDTDTLVPSADLSITKTDGAATATPGDDVTYTIVVENLGPSDSTGAVVTDSFPAALLDVVWTCVETGDATCTSAGLDTLSDTVVLAAGSSVTYTVQGTISADATGTLKNSVVVAEGEVNDPDPSNNLATDTDTLKPGADLSLVKSASPSPASAGSTLTYTFTVTNAGPGDAPDTVIVDELPDGTSFIDPSAPGPEIFADGFESRDLTAWSDVSPAPSSAAPGPLASVASCSGVGNVVTCAVGTVAADATATVAFDVAVLPTASGSLTNSATVTSGVTDPTPDDATASVTVSVKRRVDVGVEVADAPDPVAPGGVLVYTLTVTNAGPSTATGVAVGDPLPAELFPLSAVASQGSCDLAQEVVCDLGSLGPGASASVTIRTAVSGSASGAITNAAAVVANEVDLNAADDTDTEVTTILP